jgi:undecaprenyl-diphosphatase
MRNPPPSSPPRVALRQAVGLGLLHGPAELLPISSSAHTTLLAWHLGWEHEALDPAARKRFEVALHAGTTAALLLARRRDLAASLRARPAGASPARVVALACVPAALAGTLLQGPIERRLGTPRTIAAALAAGSVAMVAADRHDGRRRSRADAGTADAAALGAAQALALIPGVSRSGATRAAARWRGFSRAEADALSAAVGLPITLGALALKGREAAMRSERSEWGALGAGALGAFASTLAADAALARLGRGRGLLPYAAYRVALAGAVLRRLRQNEER